MGIPVSLLACGDARGLGDLALTDREAGAGLVVYRASDAVDAIATYARLLVEALRGAGAPAQYVGDGLSAVRRRGERPPWILLQYMPFNYGRWGFAPRLVSDAIAVRRRAGATLVVMVHEAWVAMEDWRSTVMGAYQRVQLRSLLRVADASTVSTEALAKTLGGGAVHVPVGSTITPVATTAEAARERLGLAGELIVALFGRGHPSRALDYAEAAIAAIAREQPSRRLIVLNLGSGTPALDLPGGVEVQTPGRLEEAELSLRLRASDVLLLPFTDGVSTRRTTLMAALAHGLPVVGLRGERSDAVLIEHRDALTLTPVGDRGAFARAAVELVFDRERLRASGEAGRRLYAECFDWPVAARRVLSVLGG